MAEIVLSHSDPEQKSVPILGIGQKGIGPNGELPVRREIDEWWFSSDRNDLNQQSLFILALQAFQVRGQDPEKPDPLSYLSIAGKHQQECHLSVDIESYQEFMVFLSLPGQWQIQILRKSGGIVHTK